MRKLTGNARYLFFVILLSAFTSIIGLTYLHYQYQQQQQTFVHAVANDMARQIEMRVQQALSATYATATLVRKQQGKVDGFNNFAADILRFYPGVSALQLAPAGKILYSYPLEGNEKIIGYDLLSLKNRDGSARAALLSGQLTLTGPLQLLQGGSGIVGRFPIFIPHNSLETFWGFSSVLIRDFDLIDASQQQRMTQLELGYQLSSLNHPDHPLIQSTAYSADRALHIPVALGGSAWQLSINQSTPSLYNGFYLSLLFGASAVLLLISGVYSLYRLQALRDDLQTTVEKRTRTIHDTLRHAELALTAAQQSWFQLELDSGALITGGADVQNPDAQARMLTTHSTIPLIEQPQFIATLRRHYQPGTLLDLEYLSHHPHPRWLRVIAHPQTPVNKHDRLIGVITDISAEKQARVQEHARMAVLDKLVHNKPLVDVLNAIVGMVENHNRDILCSILLADPQHKTLSVGAAPSLPTFYNDAIEGIEYKVGVGSCGTAAALKERVIVEDINKHPYWAPYRSLAKAANLAACWSEPIIDQHNNLLGTFAIYHRKPHKPSSGDMKLVDFATNLTLLAIEKTALAERLNLLFRFFNDADEGIILTNLESQIIDVNPKFTEITGFTANEVRFKTPTLLNSGQQDADFYANMWRQIHTTGHWQGELWNRRRDGKLYAEKLTVSSITNDAGEVTNYVGIFSDITRFKDQQQALQRMAYHDALTGLPNRTLLTQRFQQAAAQCQRDQLKLAICFLDLDNFKYINDTYGHSTGDDLLLQVSHRVQSCLRSEDTLSRLGGDEFAILLNGLHSEADCTEVLTRIHKLIAEPFKIADTNVKLTASTGVSVFNDSDDDLDSLLRHADQAMYRVKVQGKNSFHLFNVAEDKQLVDTHKRRNEIEHALINNEFTLYYQPKVNMRSGEVQGVEALIRWQHPHNGLQAPQMFLPHIAGSDVEVQLGNWVIEQAVQQQLCWQAAGLQLQLSINISAYHLLSPCFAETLHRILEHYPQLDSSTLQIEILESADFTDLQAIEATLQQCRQRSGLHFALDDFGTGFSSLAHLRNLSVDQIKIDCGFVRELMTRPEDFKIVEGIIRLGEAFGRSVIAEGVETVWEGKMLLLMGCEKAQGYAIARPMPASALQQWLDTWQPFAEWQQPLPQHYPYHLKIAHLLSLVLAFWQHQLQQILTTATPDAAWPVMQYERSHFANWLQRCDEEACCTQQKRQQLKHSLQALCQQADEIHHCWKQQDLHTAKDKLTEFERQVNQLQHYITSVLPEA